MSAQILANATNAAQWVCNSNEAVQLQLGSSAEELDAEDSESIFAPTFTYPIFGQEEQIFGYSGLHIDLCFSASSLYLYVNIGYDKKLDSKIGEADDIEKLLSEFLPEDTAYTRDRGQFEKQLSKDAESFQPIGTMIHSYSLEDTADDETYEIYSTRWDSDEASDLCMRIRLFPLLYIEGAQFLEEDSRWEIVTLYAKLKKETPQYRFIGLCTLYHFYHYPDKERARISQFIILPPYQGEGHGSKLYNFLFDHLKADERVVDINVEDPSEDFSDLRDKNDLRRLINDPVLKNLEAPVAGTVVNQLATEYKLNKRQTERCIEMAMLRRLSTRDEQRFKPYRLQVKQRLFQFNREALVQLDKPERLQKLHETFEGVLEDYQRILELTKLSKD
ncbi:histone acetyltransferase type B catalytic subunit [Syncephalis fuscata]|nr:histone acetyltransferase type B catalytic subunit [Syncephalis fuscata]